MPVNIIYQTSSGYALDNFVNDEMNYYILTPNNWNDYGYVTLFEVFIIKDKEIYSGMTRRVLFNDQEEDLVSSKRFDKFKIEHSHDIRDFKDVYTFISLGADYKELKELFPDEYKDILNTLNDVIYLKEKDPNSTLLKLLDSQGYKNSLLRDQSSKKSLEEDKKFLFPENYEEKEDTSAKIPLVVEEEILSTNNTTNKKNVVDLEKKIQQFEFAFTLPKSNRQYTYHFSFLDKDLPKRINVLIGKNGSGKSQTLKVLSDFLIQRQTDLNEYNIRVKIGNKFGDLVSKETIPFIQNTIVVAYNPYEDFMEYSPNIKDYSYLGFRRLENFNENFDLKKISSMTNGLEIASSLYEKYDENLKEFALLKRYGAGYNIDELTSEIIKNNYTWKKNDIEEIIELYITSISKVITDVNLPSKIVFDSFENAYNLDYTWLKNIKRLEGSSRLNAIFTYIKDAIPEVKYIALSPIDQLSKDKLRQFDSSIVKYDNEKVILSDNNDLETLPLLDFSNFKEKLLFLDLDKNEIIFSSGQEVFINLIIYLLSVIKKDSLVIIDEPENTLHPNYEVKYIEILYKILEDYKSFCIIATHSSIIVREVPKKFVHVIVIDEENNQPEVQKPIIETFGGNLTRINNYIFDDLFIKNKQYLKRLNEIASSFDTYIEFKEVYQDKLNYEMLTYIKQNWKQND